MIVTQGIWSTVCHISEKGQYRVFCKKLTRSIHGTKRYHGSLFTVPLAKQLLQQPYKLRIVVTLRSNKNKITEQEKGENESNQRHQYIDSIPQCLYMMDYHPSVVKTETIRNGLHAFTF